MKTAKTQVKGKDDFGERSMSSEKKGILFIIAGMAVFSIQDIVIKSLANQISLTQILFFRAALGTILLTSLLWFLGKPLKFGSFFVGSHF